LAPRIATRLGRKALGAALGAEAAAPLLAARARAIARGLLLLGTAVHVAEIARVTGVPVVWLKLAGLAGAGIDVVGRRDATDLDLLVPEGGAPRLIQALEREGFSRSRLPQPEHQIATLLHRDRGGLDLHRWLPGLVVAGERDPGHGTLARAGRLVDARPLAPATWTLDRALLASHALVHAAWQSGRTPSYPHLRLVGDLLDLGLAGHGSEREIVREAAAALAAEDARALLELARALGAGEAPAGRAARWLDHFLALSRVPDYGLALKTGAALAGTEAGGALGAGLRRLRRLLVLTPAEVEAIYGPQRGRAAILLRQLGRPFDLVGRAWASRAARRRLERAGRAARAQGAADQGSEGETSGGDGSSS
ncbi:MAG TPA: nucleotidyltransferase family protein, partial [Thermoanaerobaculia bacterium]|nr:nucleotidyltransferase family protein [Thermoanaerobaculia bacterium]